MHLLIGCPAALLFFFLRSGSNKSSVVLLHADIAQKIMSNIKRKENTLNNFCALLCNAGIPFEKDLLFKKEALLRLNTGLA